MAYFNSNNICLIGDSDAIIKATLLKIESKDKSLILNTGDHKNMLTVSLLNNQLNFDKIFNSSEYPSFPTLDNIFLFSDTIISACQSISTNDPMSPSFLEFFAKMFLTHDCNFSATLISMAHKDKNNDKILKSINVLFSMYRQRLRLIKLISFIEIY